MIKPVVHPEKKWVVSPDYIEYREDGNQIIFKKGSVTFWYELPEGVTFETIIHGLEVCRAEIYRLPTGKGSLL